MAPTLTLTPDVIQPKLKQSASQVTKQSCWSPFSFPCQGVCSAMCSAIYLCFCPLTASYLCAVDFNPSSPCHPISSPSSCWSPSSFLVIIACDPSLSWAACMSTGQGRAVAWNTGNLSVLHYPESDTLPAATASCQSHLREGWELMSPSTFQDWTLTGAVQCVSWVGGLCLTGFLTGLLSCSSQSPQSLTLKTFPCPLGH